MYMDLRQIREEYENRGLSEDHLVSNPIDQFKIWYSEIEEVGYSEPNAMVLSTVDLICVSRGLAYVAKSMGFMKIENT